MKVEVTYSNATKRTVEILDADILKLAQEVADTEDLKAREATKPKPVSVAAKVGP